MNILFFIILVWDYSYAVQMDFSYDNNIFSYSEEYIDDFMNHVAPHRFPFETYDDLISTAQLSFFLRNKFFNKKTTTLNLDIRINSYLVNQQKDFQNIGVGIRQSLGKYALKVSYHIIPQYLIRYYRNPQGVSTDYIGCDVRYQTFSGKVSIMPKPSLALNILYKQGWDNYVSDFDLYDAHYHLLDVNSVLELNKRIVCFLGYIYKTLENDSISIPTSGFESTPDGSYSQQSLGSHIIFKSKFLLPIQVKIGYDFNFRNYSTTFHADSMHFGRQDYVNRIHTEAEFRVFTGMLIGVSYMMQWRDATSNIVLDIDRIKDYNKYRFGVSIGFYY